MPSCASTYRRNASSLSGPISVSLTGAKLLMTELGPLDILAVLANGWSSANLGGLTRTTAMADGLEVQVLDLAARIVVMEAVGRDKDRAVLPLYRRVEQERRSGRPDSGG